MTGALDSLALILQNARRLDQGGHAVRRAADVMDTPGLNRPTARRWFESHDGARVTTIQVREDGGAWVPTGRAVDASHATYVTLNGSRRDYRGLRTVAATNDVLIVDAGPLERVAVAYVLELEQNGATR